MLRFFLKKDFMRSKYSLLLVAMATAGAIAVGGHMAAASTIYGLQFAPSGYTPYTGWASGVNVATFTAPTFNAVATTDYSLGSSGATFAITGNNYNIQNGIKTGTPTTNIAWLNTAFFLGNGSTPLTATLSGLSPSDTVDLQFIESFQTGNEPQVSVNGGTPTVINSDTSFVDVGSFTGHTSYSLVFSNAAGGTGEFDLSGGLITVTSAVPEPATLGLLGLGAAGLLLLKRRSTSNNH